VSNTSYSIPLSVVAAHAPSQHPGAYSFARRSTSRFSPGRNRVYAVVVLIVHDGCWQVLSEKLKQGHEHFHYRHGYAFQEVHKYLKEVQVWVSQHHHQAATKKIHDKHPDWISVHR